MQKYFCRIPIKCTWFFMAVKFTAIIFHCKCCKLSVFTTHQLKSTKISAFYVFNRYTANFRKYFESKWKCKCLIISTLTIWLVPRLFARPEKCSLECIIPLDINEFLFVRYMFQLRCKVTHFSRKTCRMGSFLFTSHNSKLLNAYRGKMSTCRCSKLSLGS